MFLGRSELSKITELLKSVALSPIFKLIVSLSKYFRVFDCWIVEATMKRDFE